MARAKRHYIPGQVWHITHRCHKREFLLNFIKDRQRWVHWLYVAKKRYGLVILDYAVTSNHIHLLVVDDKERNVIPDSIKLIAGRTGQEYNQRKKRKGAFWEDRYHATAVEDGEHLRECLVYIDLNMVRAGVVNHPVDWAFGGYNQIQEPKRKKVLIDYERLRSLLGFESYEQVKDAHKKWVEIALKEKIIVRDDKWSKSIAVGRDSFIEGVKAQMGFAAIGRRRIAAGDSFQLREHPDCYGDVLGVENIDIGQKNTYFWH
jgi:putative transposase